MKNRVMACLAAAVIFLNGASIWEGVAEVSSGDLPKGLYAATNSYPKNTVVDIINLENGKSVRVIVTAGLDTQGLLAIISAEAAEIIGLQSRSAGRIRMSQPQDIAAFSRIDEGLAAGFPDNGLEDNTDETYLPENKKEELADGNFPSLTDEVPDIEQPQENGYFLGEKKPEEPNYRLVPAPERPPAVSGFYGIDPESIIPGIGDIYYYVVPDAVPHNSGEKQKPLPAPAAPVPAASARSSPFSVPLVDRLERGSYYVQLAAFSRAELAQSEISRIDRSYPVTVFNSGGTTAVYRILLGPLNLGESAAVLKRFKSIGYKDAFIREG
jgi:hypothetical protein